jgi:hypothetical protein
MFCKKLVKEINTLPLSSVNSANTSASRRIILDYNSSLIDNGYEGFRCSEIGWPKYRSKYTGVSFVYVQVAHSAPERALQFHVYEMGT